MAGGAWCARGRGLEGSERSANFLPDKHTDVRVVDIAKGCQGCQGVSGWRDCLRATHHWSWRAVAVSIERIAELAINPPAEAQCAPPTFGAHVCAMISWVAATDKVK